METRNCKIHPWAVHGEMDTAWFVKVFTYDHELDKPVRSTTGRLCALLYTCTYVHVHVHYMYMYMYTTCTCTCVNGKAH